MSKLFTANSQAITDKRLSLVTLRLYLLLCDYRNCETGECWPSLATLAKQLGTARCHILSHMKKLCDLGYIEKRPSKHKSNTYYIPFEGGYQTRTQGGYQTRTQGGYQTRTPNNIIEQNKLTNRYSLKKNVDKKEEEYTFDYISKNVKADELDELISEAGRQGEVSRLSAYNLCIKYNKLYKNPSSNRSTLLKRFVALLKTEDLNKESVGYS